MLHKSAGESREETAPLLLQFPGLVGPHGERTQTHVQKIAQRPFVSGLGASVLDYLSQSSNGIIEINLDNMLESINHQYVQNSEF